MEDLVAMYYAMIDDETPWPVKVVIAGALVYFVNPFDVVPDAIPVVGYGDDATVVATAYATARAFVMPRHRRAARRLLRG